MSASLPLFVHSRVFCLMSHIVHAAMFNVASGITLYRVFGLRSPVTRPSSIDPVLPPG